MFFKIVPKFSYKRHKNHRHFKGCWKRYGTKSRRAKAQSILPCNSAWPFKSRLEDFKVNICFYFMTDVVYDEKQYSDLFPERSHGQTSTKRVPYSLGVKIEKL